MGILGTLAHVALALWIGAVAGIAALVAPATFRVLADETGRAAELLRPVFAGVDSFGIGAAVLLVLTPRPRWQRVLAAAMGLMAATSVLLLAPMIRDGGRNTAHYIDEGLWALILLGGLVLLAAGSLPPAAARGAASGPLHTPPAA